MVTVAGLVHKIWEGLTDREESLLRGGGAGGVGITALKILKS